jgi:acyl dehydratase
MELSAFEAPIDRRHFEDYNKGARFEYGPILVEETEIISCARGFDPQSIHTDPEAASRGPFSGLIASGWHTIGLMMRLIVDHYLSAVASLGGPLGSTKCAGSGQSVQMINCDSAFQFSTPTHHARNRIAEWL